MAIGHPTNASDATREPPPTRAHRDRTEPRSADAVLDELAAVARRAGIDVDREESGRWLQAVSIAVATPGEFARSVDGELGGHELALIDFDPAAAERLRRIGRLVATPKQREVRTALAIAGSSAQGRHQPFPADVDFFERVHIKAPSRERAVSRLARIVRDTARLVGARLGFQLEGVSFGVVDGHALCWTPDELAAGRIERRLDTGQIVSVSWRQAATDPGFIKFDWALVEPALGEPGRVSKVIDATWESPQGTVVSLDGAIDDDFQQVYLDAEAADLAAALTAGLAPGSADHYAWLMEREIAKYCRATPPDYAKVAKRLYNLCRLRGRFAEALYLRALFDEPAARLHQLRVRLEMADRLSADDRIALAGEIQALALVQSGSLELTDREALDRWARAERRDGTLSPAGAVEPVVDALARLASATFERELRAYPPVASLIDEIKERQADSSRDDHP